jgi:formate hydrogenlyase subunit 3/multisubunit Na+/H+ antiporter MnhD subunit
VLSALGLSVGALLGLGLLGASGLAPRLVAFGSAAMAALFLVAGGLATPGTLALPFGPPGFALQLALDPLSAWFLLILSVVALPAALMAAASGFTSRAEAAAFPLFLAGMALTLLAGDVFALLLGFEAMSLASWALVAARHPIGEGRRAARLYLGFAAFSGLCLLGGLALLAAPGIGFAAIRAAPPEGWRAVTAMALVLLGAGSKAGLLPFHLWLPLAHPAAATPVSALMSGAMVKVALYVLARALFDLAGPAQPGWWGVPLMVLGAMTALWGALRANTERDIKAILAGSTLDNVGIIALALGAALLFRGADLLPLAAVALAAALLHAMAHGVFKGLLFLSVGAVYERAGSRDPDRLGGLIHRMPVVAGVAMLGAASAAALPPFAGFAGEWLLLQALLQGWRVADLASQLLIAAALAAVGMAAALAAAAMLRLLGLVFLGRPRTPRAAGAEDVGGLARLALGVAALFCALCGVFAAPLVAMSGGAVAQLLGGAHGVPAAGLALSFGEGGAGYAPLAVCLALLLLLAVLWRAVRRVAGPEPLRGPAWDCGFQPPPAHLPFGDPLTQASALGAAQPIRRALGPIALALREAHVPAAPGEAAPARLRVFARDRGFGALILPLARARRWAGHQAERLRALPLGAYLALAFSTLVVLLAVVAGIERP